jgi:hypothetical protein
MFDTLVKSLVLIVDEVIAKFEKTSKEQIVKSSMKQKVSGFKFQISIDRHGELEVPSLRTARPDQQNARRTQSRVGLILFANREVE